MRNRVKQLASAASGCLAALALAAGGAVIRAEVRGGRGAEAALSAEQAVACVRAAVAAKPGNVHSLEAENEGGKVVCEVEVLAQDGKTYEVEIDAATNAVVEVEEDND
ncbi:MAG TPA: PepSY domain-containing protein [Pyrinomonadaceae bacterium]|jgi:uncharacterized membrane protein YkoI